MGITRGNIMKQHKKDLIEFTVGNHNLCALINGDVSGLCDTELLQLQLFEQKAIQIAKNEGAKSWHWSTLTECSNYQKCEISGLYSDCSDIALVLMF